MHKKIVTVVGARPQFVKAAAMSRAFERLNGCREVLVHTGQHFDPQMSGSFFDELNIPTPAYNLGISGGVRHEMVALMQRALRDVLRAERPDMVVLYGDTNSTLAGALAAAQAGFPIAHIEAGLRSFNPAMAEERNRIRTDHLSSLLLCPTRAAVQNLRREGIKDCVHHVGDVMYDAALSAGGAARNLAHLGQIPDRFTLATLHRAENTDDPARLKAALAYIEAAAQKRPVLLPLHPRLRLAMTRHGLSAKGATCIDPLGYFDMQALLRRADLVLTDSGGLQKEAYFHRTPCITLRDETEWGETIEAGWNRLWHAPAYLPRREISEYGRGQAAMACAHRIKEFLTQAKPANGPSPLAMAEA